MEYTFLSVKVENFNVSVDAGLNHEIFNTRTALPNDPIYQFDSHIKILGECIYPEERANCKYGITITSYVGNSTRFDSVLKDYHVRDEEFNRKYKRIRGEEILIYDPPKGIGYIEKRKGTDIWMCYASVSPQTINDMHVLLSNIKPLSVEIHEVKKDRNRLVRSVTLQTNNPIEE